MPKNHFVFTKEKLNKLNIEKGKSLSRFYDAKQSGLLLTIRVSGRKSFVVRHKLNGKDVVVTLGKFPDMGLEQARKKTREALNTITDGINPNIQKQAAVAKNTTLSQCLADYLRVNHNLAKSTKDSYHVSAYQYLGDWLDKPLITISRDMVEKRHLKIGKKSPTRANYTMRLIRALFNFAHGEYEDENGEPLFIHNPVARISHKKLWFKETRRNTFISSKDLPAWYGSVITLPEWIDNPLVNAEPMRDYLLFIWLTGLRRQECAMIEKRWISIDNRTLTIPSNKTKNGHEHQLPLSDYLMKITNDRMRNNSDYLFTGKTEKDYLKEPKRVIEQVRKQSGVYFTLHDLRRTFITNAENLGFTGYTLKRLLNHRDKSDVTDEYIVTDAEYLRPIMQAITDRLLAIATSSKNENVIQLFK